ncbi:MAG: peptidoglycan-binding protein [Actinomycetes bacterium]
MSSTDAGRRLFAFPVSLGRVVTAGMTAAALVTACVGTAAPSSAVAAAVPKAPRSAPRVVEGFTPYLPQVSCDPGAKPGTVALRSRMMRTFGGRDLGISRACSVGGLSEHKEGRAWDWGLRASNRAEKARATAFLRWLMAKGPRGMRGYNARRLGVMYVIYNGRIWGAYRASEGWRKYSGSESHGNHIHISLAWNGAMKRTSWWTGRKARTDYGPCVRIRGWVAPRYSGPRFMRCPTPTDPMDLIGTPRLSYGMSSPYVLQLQRRLGVRPVTGYFGPLTKAALTRFQRAHHLPATATTTRATWRALRAGATVSRSAPRLPARMSYRVRRGDSVSEIAARWRSTVPAIRSANRLRGDRINVGQVLIVPVRSSLTRYTYHRVRPGSRGTAVKVLQTTLHMRPKYRTGFFGPITKARVNAVKRRHHWRPDGVVGTRVWRALGA